MHIYLTFSSSDVPKEKLSVILTAFFSVCYLFNPFSFLDFYTASLINFAVLRVGAVHINHSYITVNY